MSDSIGVLESVHSFYSDSFSQLITITIAFLVFAGVVMPLMIQFYQSRSLRRDKEYLEALLKTKTDEARNDLESDLTTRFAEEQEKIAALIEQQISDAIAPIERKTDIATAGLFHLQALSHKDSGFPELALKSCCDAIPGYLSGMNESNLQAVLCILTEDCLPGINMTDIERDSEIVELINGVAELLLKHNENGRYTRVERKIRWELQAAKLREAPAQ